MPLYEMTILSISNSIDDSLSNIKWWQYYSAMVILKNDIIIENQLILTQDLPALIIGRCVEIFWPNRNLTYDWSPIPGMARTKFSQWLKLTYIDPFHYVASALSVFSHPFSIPVFPWPSDCWQWPLYIDLTIHPVPTWEQEIVTWFIIIPFPDSINWWNSIVSSVSVAQIEMIHQTQGCQNDKW